MINTLKRLSMQRNRTAPSVNVLNHFFLLFSA
jgi:hypothetical protein